MKITIKGDGLQLYEDTKKYVDDKIISVIKKYFDDSSTAVDVAIKDINGPKGGVDKEISVVITIAGEKNPIKITERHTHVWEAIDKAAETTNRVLRKLKDKRRNEHRKTAQNHENC